MNLPKNPTLAIPIALAYLLHAYTTRAPFPGHANDPQQNAAEFLRLVGAIELDEETPTGPIYRATPKGEAWISVLLSTPAPRETFVDAQGRVIPHFLGS